MKSKFIIKNGELIKTEEANISVYNKAWYFDFVVYSNIKIIQGKMFLPELEINKLFASAEKIGIKTNFTKDDIINWMKKLIEKNNLQDALVRLLLIGQEKDSEPILFLFPVGLTFYPNKFYTQGVKLSTYQGERFLPTVKSKNLLLNYIAYRQAVDNKAMDALLIDHNNNITEGTRTSFFVIKNDTLIMPPKETTLEGVTRKIISEIAPQIMKVKEEIIKLEAVKNNNYDECFISGTSLNIMPVRQIDDVILNETVGEKTKQLQKMYKEYCEKKMF